MGSLSLADELRWLKANPQFKERPATLREFLGANYLDIEKRVRKAIIKELEQIFGDEVDGNHMTRVQRAMITGGIGIGKTTVASIVLPYMAHWVLCLKDPQDFFDLLPGSRIAFMQMSTSEDQAKEVVFGDIKARIEHSAWFKNHPYDRSFKNQLRFEKDIWILPGDSKETTFEGYNILGGILDEADSHQVTKVKDYAEAGYNCVDEATEILSQRGWLAHGGLVVGDQVLTLNHETGLSEWNPVQEVCSWSVVDHELTRMEGMEFSSLTTANHRWPVLWHDERKWETTDSLQSRSRIITCAENADLPNDPKHTDDFVELVAWIYTEGHVRPNGFTFGITQNRDTEGECRIVAALTRMFGEPAKSLHGSKIPSWSIQAHRTRRTLNFSLNQYASAVVLSALENKVPTWDFILSLTRAQLALFLEVSLLADNCGDEMFAQKNWAGAEVFAFAAILLGKSVSIRPHKTPGRDYDMLLARILKKTSISPRQLVSTSTRFAITKESHTGTIWCPRTQNQSWMARRDGSVYFTGNTISARITSRFEDRGFLLVIGQMKKANGFAARKYAELKKDANAYVVRMAIWESMGWDHYMNPDGTRNSFWYDPERKDVVPSGVVTAGLHPNKDSLIEIPMMFMPDFINNPERALRDHAGIPPATGSPFISLTYKITEAVKRWEGRNPNSPGPVDEHGRIANWFTAKTSLKHVGHLDIAYSGNGDALGLAMGHVQEVVEIDGELKPYIVIDMLMRIAAPAGREIFLGDVRRIIYDLRDHRKFKLVKMTMDGFQCFTGDTEVPLLDGRVLTMAQLAAAYPEGGVHTYSWDGTQIIPGKVTRAWRTGQKKVISVLLDNGEMVRCTEDHRWMRRDGSYVQARNLVAGDSLMPLYRRTTPDDWKGLRGYEQVWQPRDGARGGRKWQFTHKMAFAEYVPEGHVIHHGDVNKLNNDPTNLRLMSLDDHLQWHREHGQGAFKELWANPEFRAKTSAAVSKSNAERVGRDARRYRHDITVEALAEFRHLTRRDLTIQTGWSQDAIYDRVREAGFDGWADFRKNYAPSNHKVVGVFDFGEVEDVYDLTVEDHHNFALQAGVFVHNSTDTKQQFQKRRIESEIVSIDKQLTPYYDLREAIYEDRIEFPPYFVRLRPDDTTLTEIGVKELMELVDNGNKIDHTTEGSKDVADAMAGVIYELMGDRTYRKVRVAMDFDAPSNGAPNSSVPRHPAIIGGPIPTMPRPPTGVAAWNPPQLGRQ